MIDIQMVLEVNSLRKGAEKHECPCACTSAFRALHAREVSAKRGREGNNEKEEPGFLRPQLTSK